MPPEIIYSSLLGLAVTVVVGAVLVWTRRWHGALSYDHAVGPHKFHETPTPRIGGLALYAGYWAAASISPPPVRELLFAVGASAVFAFLAGTAEDFIKMGGIALRLVAPMLSGLAFCLLTGYAVTRVEIPFVDRAMALPFVAIAFTAFAMAGLAHALNIVDGFNGLAAGTAIIMLVAFAVVSLVAGDRDMASFCFVIAGILLGFLLMNFPFGHIFLGDGGSYLLGFIVASAAVSVPVRNPDVSPWVSVVVLAYPLLETAFSVTRKIRRGGSPFRPDRLHLHMLVYRRFGRRLARTAGNERLANPVTGALMWGGSLASLAAVALVPHDRDRLLVVLALLLALYALAYRRVARSRPHGAVFAKRSPGLPTPAGPSHSMDAAHIPPEGMKEPADREYGANRAVCSARNEAA